MDKIQWQSHVTALKDSGLSARAYAEQHSLVYHQLLYRCRQFCDDDRSNQQPFASVQVKSSTAQPLGVVEFPSGARLLIHSTELLAMLPHWLSR